MSYELRLTLLLIALIVLLAGSIFATKLPFFLRKGMALFSLLTVLMLLIRVYSEGGAWLQMEEHLRKNPAVAAWIGQEPLIQGESRQGEWEGRPVTVQSFSAGTDWFAAVVDRTRSPYYWIPRYRVRAVFRDEGFQPVFDAAFRKIDPIARQSTFDPQHMECSLTLSIAPSTPSSEYETLLRRFADGIAAEPNGSALGLPYRIDFGLEDRTTDRLLAQARKETGSTEFTWLKRKQPAPAER